MNGALDWTLVYLLPQHSFRACSYFFHRPYLDGTLDGLSIGFAPIRQKWSADRTEVERLEVALREVSAVWAPAYEQAEIAGVRFDRQVLSAEAAQARLKLLELQR